MNSQFLRWIIELPFLAEILVKTTLFLVAMWIAHFLLRRANPRWRVLLWRGAAVGLLAVPILRAALPELPVPVAPSPSTPASPACPVHSRPVRLELAPQKLSAVETPSPPRVEPRGAASAVFPVTRQRTPFSPLSWARKDAVLFIASGWILVASVLAARFYIGWRRVRRIVKSAALAPPALSSACHEIAHALGVGRCVQVRLSDEISSPFLTGVRRPLLILPCRIIESAHSPELRAILAHELSHLRSNDLLWSYVFHWLSIVLWFHPLVWRIRSAHASACEEVSDAIAADFVGDVGDYSRTLARVALDLASRSPAAAGIPMARVSDITRRLRALKRKTFSLPLRPTRIALSLMGGLIALALLTSSRPAFTKSPPKKSDTAESETRILPALSPATSQGADSTEEQPGEERGRIRGVVLNADTGEPVVGAQVAVGHHLAENDVKRIREGGVGGTLQLTTETNKEGRFVLEDVAFWDYHLFSVKRQGFVPHEQWIALRRDKPDIESSVRLKPAAAITVKVVNAEGMPMLGQVVRLESKDGHALLPARGEWRPELPYRTEMAKMGICSFEGLAPGAYSIEAALTALSETVHHGTISDVSLKSGDTNEIVLKPANHRSVLTVKVEKDPHAASKWAALVMISRNRGLLAWAAKSFYHPEDDRLARVMQYTINTVTADSPNDSRFGAVVWDDSPYTFRNFPPGAYAVLALTWGDYKWRDKNYIAVCIRGAAVEIAPGKELTVVIPWAEPQGPSPLNPRVLDNKVTLEAREYGAQELCDLIVKAVGAGDVSPWGSQDKVVADASIRDEKVAFPAGEISLWDLVERTYLLKRWRLEADFEAERLVFRPST